MLLCKFTGKPSGDPRTDDCALKKEKYRSKRQAPETRGVHARIQKIFRQGRGSSPITHQQDWSSLRQGGERYFLENREGSAPPPPLRYAHAPTSPIPHACDIIAGIYNAIFGLNCSYKFLKNYLEKSSTCICY